LITRKETALAINIQRFNEVVAAAKSRTRDERRLESIDKAVAGFLGGGWIVTEFHDGLIVATDGGETYRANGKCERIMTV